MGKRLLFLTVFIVIAFSTFITLQKVEALKGGLKEGKDFYIPSSQFLKPAILGYDSMAADLYWLRAVQYIGDRFWFEKKYPQLYPILDLVTDLDPKFEYAYEVGGIILSVYAKRIDESIAILKKGDEEELGYWELPFYLGFNYFYYLGDYTTAADYIVRASEMPRSPAYLPKLAARLHAQAGNPETALEFLYRVYEATEDENVKKELEERMKDVMVERDIQYLEGAIDVYKERFGEYPETLDLIVSRGIIKSIPEEPFGGYYYIDSETRVIKSSIKKERLKVYRQKLIRND